MTEVLACATVGPRPHVLWLYSVQILRAKNTEVETAVEDLLQCLSSYPLDDAVGGIPEAELDRLRLHFNKQMYQVMSSRA